jgi:hypothetical protein
MAAFVTMDDRPYLVLVQLLLAPAVHISSALYPEKWHHVGWSAPSQTASQPAS